MQVLSNTRWLSRVLKSPIFIFSERLLAPDALVSNGGSSPLSLWHYSRLSFADGATLDDDT